jgi:hypothetical protein
MIIGLSGYARSGKDTVAELLCLNYGYKRISFADPMRQAILTLNPKIDSITHVSHLVEDYGWDFAKQNPEVRRLLQVFGTEIGRKMFGENVWVDMAFKQIEPDAKVVIADVRFPNEGDAIKSRGGKVIRVNRHNHSAVNSHKSEIAMDNYMFDHVIYNDGTLDDLAENVFMWMRSAFKQ